MNTTGNMSGTLRSKVATTPDTTDTSLHEIFEKVGNEKSIKEKVKILQTWDTPALRAVLRGAYDSSIRWLVPNTKPPFEPNDAEDWGLAPLRLDVEIMKQIKNYVARKTENGQWGQGYTGLTQTRREQLFIQMIEGLHITEVEIVFGMINRKLPYTGLTPKLVAQAFPGLLPDGTPG